MKLRFTPEAIRDIQSVSDYITNKLGNPSAAARIKKSILKSCSLLKNQPLMGGSVAEKTGRETDLRYHICEEHLIFYRALEKEILIARVLSGRMDYISILFGQSWNMGAPVRTADPVLLKYAR